jgi:hypothetical protein
VELEEGTFPSSIYCHVEQSETSPLQSKGAKDPFPTDTKCRPERSEGSPPYLPQKGLFYWVIVYNIPGCDLEETYLSLYLVCMVIRYGEKWVNFVGHWFFETVRNVKPTSPVPSPCTWYIRHKACIYDDRVKGTCSISHQQYTLV